ncbi:MAG: ATP-binding protein [Candidatus Taylorbacteria bacterium]
MKRTFSKRYLLLPIILAVFIILFFLVYEDIKNRTIDEFNNEQLILAQTASQGITSFFTDYQADLNFLAQFKNLIDFNSGSKAILASFYENHKNNIEAVSRINAHGVILYTYPENESVIGKDISYQKHVREVIATHKPVISDVFKAAQGYLAIALHVPIFKGNEYVGSLAMLISIDRLGKMYLGKIKIRGTGNVWLLSENGIEIYCPVSGHKGNSFLYNTHNDASARELMENIRKEDHGKLTSVHSEIILDNKSLFIKKHVTFYRAPLGNTYWTIAISYLDEDIYIALTRLRNRLILIFTLLFAIISYYFYSIAQVRTVLKAEAKRKEAERVLRESEDRFKKLSNLTFEGILIHNKGVAIDANESFIKMVGYGRDELIGKDVIKLLVSQDDQEKIKTNLTDERPDPYEVILRKKNGTIFPVEIEAKEIKYKNENFRVAAIRDISERKQSEKELLAAKEKAEESDRLKSAFLANMSHEIRTPMNGILGFTELLREPDLTGEEQQHYIDIIKKSGERLLKIINDIIDISKIESELVEVSISETNINEQIKFIFNFFQPEVEQKGIHFSYTNSLSPEDANINTDREKIYAILFNLVKNAVKYTKAGSIEFGYKKPGDYLEFFVKDTGIGIPKDRQVAIFERFIQADISDKMAMQGAGLGLSITKAYVELLNGTIRVESKEGKGSTFYFTLPYHVVHKEQNVVESPTRAAKEKNHLENLRILITEDDESAELLLSILVKMYCKEILVAKNGIEAVELCRNHPDLDLVLMDIQLPLLSGYEATRQIRKFNKDVVIIAQTAFALTGDREKAIEAGCSDYITKPINHGELQELIQKYFNA